MARRDLVDRLVSEDSGGARTFVEMQRMSYMASSDNAKAPEVFRVLKLAIYSFEK